MKKSNLCLALLLCALFVVSFVLVACDGGYTLTFETNGGSAIQPIKFKSGQKVTPPTANKTNFTFGGWYADVDLEVPFDKFDKMPDSDVTVYAKWKAGESAKIVFETNGGSDVEPMLGIVGQPTTEPTAPTKKGYVFAGWYSDEECTQLYVFGSLLESGTTTLYAKWNPDSDYNYVTYHLNGAVTVVPVQKGHKATVPKKADDVECTWYKDESFTIEYDFNANVNDSFPLYGLMYSKGLTFDGATVTAYSGSSSNVYVPAKHGGTIITTIGDGAFAYNTSIKYVTLADTVTAIKGAAFYNCQYLVDVNVTSSVTEIGEFAFANCLRMIATIDLTGVSAVADSAFANCAWLETVIFGSQLTTIGNNAFINCSSLTTATLTNSIESIGDYAFAYSGITTLNVPSSLTNLGTGVVKGASKLASVSGGNDTFKVDGDKGTVISGATLLLYVTTGENANDTEYTLPTDITEIAPYAFYGNATIQKLDVSGASQLSLSSLEGIKALASLTVSKFDSQNPYLAYWFGASDAKKNTSSGLYVPDSLKEVKFVDYSSEEVANYAFYGCNGLATIKGIDGVTEIGAYAFGYTAIEEYEVSADVTSIDHTAFYGAKDLQKITVDGDNEIYHSYDNALYMGKTLVYVPEGKTSVSIEEQADTIGAGALYRSKVVELIVPDTILSIGFGAFEKMTRLTSLTVPFIGGSKEENTYMMYVFGAKVWADKENNSPFCDFDKCPATLRSIRVTDEVATIPEFAFAFCLHVTEINCGTDYTSVGYAAFAQTGLTSFTVPDSVTTIDSYAYFACADLVNLVIGSGVTTIGDWAFGFLASVETIEFREGANDLTIGESAFEAYTYVDNDDFENAMSELKTLKLSSNVVSIGNKAFKYVGYHGITFYDDYPEPLIDDNASYTYLEVDLQGSRLKTLGDQAFYFSGIAKVTLPATVTTIGEKAFYNSVMLTSVTVGASDANSQLTSIKNEAFKYCDRFERFTLYKQATAVNQTPTLGKNVFEGTIVNVYVPKDNLDVYKRAWESGYNIVSIQVIEEAQS